MQGPNLLSSTFCAVADGDVCRCVTVTPPPPPPVPAPSICLADFLTACEELPLTATDFNDAIVTSIPAACQHPSASVSIRQHPSASVSIRQHTRYIIRARRQHHSHIQRHSSD
jgi:hypothetical protein